MYQKTLPIEWFTSRIGTTVLRNGKDFNILNPETAQYCYDIQGESFVFTDKSDAVLSKVTIHTPVPEAICESCQ